ncbi:unnamed protein product [Pipistrellus nathusii]|uniref:Uncharacterized protein n=1 Tax=Pipistrellus nathusii TaxID=59473 RepID=A0ABN9Z5H3_PIPNA
MNSPRDPNPPPRPRTDRALCLFLGGLLPVGAPAQSTFHPALQALQAQWAWGSAARAHRETEHCPICPPCCRHPCPCYPELDPARHDLGWAGGENSKDSAQPPPATSAASETSLKPPGSDPSSAALGRHNFGGTGGGGIEAEECPAWVQGSLAPSRTGHMETPPPPIRMAADRSGQAA